MYTRSSKVSIIHSLLLLSWITYPLDWTHRPVAPVPGLPQVVEDSPAPGQQPMNPRPKARSSVLAPESGHGAAARCAAVNFAEVLGPHHSDAPQILLLLTVVVVLVAQRQSRSVTMGI